jgi:hypothetical protein
MKLFAKAADGGKGSGVTAYFLIECKSLFSVALLHFAPGSREAYHEHAFNAWTLWLKGRVTECILRQDMGVEHRKLWWPWDLKYTHRNRMHKILAGPEGAWCVTIRGPWSDRWREWRNGKTVTLTHGRKEINDHTC